MSRKPFPDVRDEVCGRLAADMTYLDHFWAESKEEVNAVEEDERQRRRIEYIRKGDGTYNPGNGHFYCDQCFIKLGMPSGRAK